MEEMIWQILAFLFLIGMALASGYVKKAKNYSKKGEGHLKEFVEAWGKFNERWEDDELTPEEIKESYNDFKKVIEAIINQNVSLHEYVEELKIVK